MQRRKGGSPNDGWISSDMPSKSDLRGAGSRMPHPPSAGCDEERLLPAKARREDELPPHTRTVALPRCGHIAMWDEPEFVAQVILDGAAPAAG
jgi:pimeloyl-ACP methyl ester carboxylesterase